MTPAEPRKKSLKIWIILLVLPFALLVLTVIVQFAAQFLISETTVDTSQPIDTTGLIEGTSEEYPVEPNTAKTVVNIISAVIGIGSVLMIIIGTPIWITMLVIASNHNQKLEQQKQQSPPTHDV